MGRSSPIPFCLIRRFFFKFEVISKEGLRCRCFPGSFVDCFRTCKHQFSQCGRWSLVYIKHRGLSRSKDGVWSSFQASLLFRQFLGRNCCWNIIPGSWQWRSQISTITQTSEAYSERIHVSKMELFAKNYFRKMLYHKYLTRFWINLSIFFSIALY